MPWMWFLTGSALLAVPLYMLWKLKTLLNAISDLDQ
jgi:hypothetical protein